MDTETVRKEIDKWYELVHPLRMRNILHSLCNYIDHINDKIKKLESERIVKEAVETAPESADSSDSDAEYALSGRHVEECCGNCSHFRDEDTERHGWCAHPQREKATECSASCSLWSHRPFNAGEAVMFKTHDSGQAWKLGYYCSKTPFGHCLYFGRSGGRTITANIVRAFDTFNPYSDKD